MPKYSTPTEKQIIFANKIARTLNIEFPFNSKQYNKREYSKFISTNLEDYHDAIAEYQDPEDYVDMCMNDIWTEHY